jgi:hypothetical protein
LSKSDSFTYSSGDINVRPEFEIGRSNFQSGPISEFNPQTSAFGPADTVIPVVPEPPLIDELEIQSTTELQELPPVRVTTVQTFETQSNRADPSESISVVDEDQH